MIGLLQLSIYAVTKNEATLMWANEIFDGKHPDTFGEPV
jgi:hypothetical protein